MPALPHVPMVLLPPPCCLCCREDEAALRLTTEDSFKRRVLLSTGAVASGEWGFNLAPASQACMPGGRVMHGV